MAWCGAIVSQAIVRNDMMNQYPRSLHKHMTPNLLQRITHDPDLCHGKPCIRGLRYPIEFILELLSSGMTHAEILEDYEDLEPEDLYAVLLFAARLSQIKSVITKDSDFVDSFLTIHEPYKLLLISTGNIKNSELETLFATHLTQIISLLHQHSYIEISQTLLIIHQ